MKRLSLKDCVLQTIAEGFKGLSPPTYLFPFHFTTYL